MELAAKNGWTLVFEHDAYVQAAKIEKGERGYEIFDEITISPKIQMQARK
jgi:hypothetical protein